MRSKRMDEELLSAKLKNKTMGTRSLTHIKDEDGKTLTTIYKQYDGYPEGLGKELHEFLKGRKILNGYQGDEDQHHCNGMGCLAARLIGHLKEDKIGNVYVYSPDAKDCGEEFTYTIYPSEETKDEVDLGKRKWARTIRKPMMKIMDGDTVLYDGPADDFTPDKCKQKEEL